MTRKQRIIRELKKPHMSLSCKQACDIIIKAEKIKPGTNKRRYLSGSVSSLLRKMVVDGVLQYSDDTTWRGGHIYELNPGAVI